MFFQSNNRISAKSVGYFAPLQAATIQHLKQVYLSLAALVVAASVGSLVELYSHVGGLLTLIATFAAAFWLAVTPYQPNDAAHNRKRFGIALAIAFLVGISLGPLIQMTLSLDAGASIIFNAFMGTAIVFGCFSAAALYADRRSILFVGGVISSLSALLFWSFVANLFLRSEMIFDIRLYLGLAMFCLFVVFDTQVIIFDCQTNNKYDVVSHSLEFFYDCVGIFVRLLILLNKKESKKSNKKK